MVVCTAASIFLSENVAIAVAVSLAVAVNVWATSSNSLKLWIACSSGDIGEVEAELARGVNVNWTNAACDSKFTSLMAAVHRGQDVVVQRLLQHPGMNANIPSSAGFTALHVACYKGHVEILRMLLAAQGQNSYNSIECNFGNTPLMCAVTSKKLECVKLMLGVEEVDLETKDSKGKGLKDWAR